MLQYVAGWASVGSGGGGSASKRRGSLGAAAVEGQPPPICLVHGPFGSGEQCGFHGACMAPHFARSGAHRCCHWVGRSVMLNRELPVSTPCRQVHPAGGSAALPAGAAHARGVTPGGRPHAGQVRQLCLGMAVRRSSTGACMRCDGGLKSAAAMYITCPRCACCTQRPHQRGSRPRPAGWVGGTRAVGEASSLDWHAGLRRCVVVQHMPGSAPVSQWGVDGYSCLKYECRPAGERLHRLPESGAAAPHQPPPAGTGGPLLSLLLI